MMADQTYHLSTVQDLIAMCPIVSIDRNIWYLMKLTNIRIDCFSRTLCNIYIYSFLQVPWIQYISNTTNMSISNETIINIKTPSYFRHLGQIIAQTDKE